MAACTIKHSVSAGVMMLFLMSCAVEPPDPVPPGNPANPFAEFGCLENPNLSSCPKILYDVELGRAYEFPGGSYQLVFDLAEPSRVRATITELDPYDSLALFLGDSVDALHLVTFYHDAGPGSTEEGPALTEVMLESKERLEVTVGFTIYRTLSDYTLRNDEGKRLLCQPYKVVLERVP